MSIEEKEVELYNCWTWTCPECKEINYHNGNSLKLNENDKELMIEQMSEALGVELDSNNDIVMVPNIVFCKKCEGKFRTT